VSAQTTPIDVQCISDIHNGDPMGYYAKGHHDPAAFLEAVVEQCSEERENLAEPVRHVYYRNVPLKNMDADFLLQETEKGPGAYPVTTVAI
jgi:hypothetical protein